MCATLTNYRYYANTMRRKKKRQTEFLTLCTPFAFFDFRFSAPTF